MASTHTNPGLAGFLEEGTFHLVLRDEEELARRDERESVVGPVQKQLKAAGEEQRTSPTIWTFP